MPKTKMITKKKHGDLKKKKNRRKYFFCVLKRKFNKLEISVRVTAGFFLKKK
jgi:hypothetical protein